MCSFDQLPGSKLVMHLSQRRQRSSPPCFILGLKNKQTADQAAGRMEVNEVEKETRMSQSSEQREGARQGICRLLFQQAGEVALQNNILPLCQNK